MLSKTDRKICGTCKYWFGERNPILTSKGVPKVDICDCYGICQNQYSLFFDKIKKRDFCCKHFSKWVEIL